MKYHVKEMTPEFRAITYSKGVFALSLLFALNWNLVSITQFFFGYSVVFLISLIVSHYQTTIIDESKITIHD